MRKFIETFSLSISDIFDNAKGFYTLLLFVPQETSVTCQEDAKEDVKKIFRGKCILIISNKLIYWEYRDKTMNKVSL